MPECFECTTLAKKALYNYSSFPFFSWLWGDHPYVVSAYSSSDWSANVCLVRKSCCPVSQMSRTSAHVIIVLQSWSLAPRTTPFRLVSFRYFYYGCCKLCSRVRLSVVWQQDVANVWYTVRALIFLLTQTGTEIKSNQLTGTETERPAQKWKNGYRTGQTDSHSFKGLFSRQPR